MMRADYLIKNAKIFTADKDMPWATALAVKDGKFVYVGEDQGLSGYEGEVRDLQGRLILPALIDSHAHVTLGVGSEYLESGVIVECTNKKEAMDFMAEYIKDNPGVQRYPFELAQEFLNGETITKEELDVICPESELLITEAESHSVWVNSIILKRHGITDETPDIVPGLSYYIRKDGHITGNAYESAAWQFLFDYLRNLTEEQMETALMRWIADSVKYGVSCVFDAGFPENNDLHERIYACLRELDRQGRLPVYIDGCYVLTRPEKISEAVEETKRFRREFNTEHLKVHTLKIFMDGTLKIRTAALLTPYEGTEATGAAVFDKEGIAEILERLNEAGLDLHLHTVGEAASHIVLDGVELARKRLGKDFRVKVTCAHLEIQDDADIGRFAGLGVFANFTPWWHAGDMRTDPLIVYRELLGEKRAHSMYRCKSLWDSGAVVTFSSDEIFFGDHWNPYLGMEVGMTRWITEKTKAEEYVRTAAAFPPEGERMSLEEMILGYTINGAKQLGIEARKGSVEAGKDADFLVFDIDLFAAEQEGFSNLGPGEIWFSGEKLRPQA